MGWPGGLASEGRGFARGSGLSGWHDNGYAPRLSLNKVGVFPRFAAFGAILLRLAGSCASETRQIFPYLGKICLHTRQILPACIYNVNLFPMSFPCAFFPFPLVSLVLCRFSPFLSPCDSKLACLVLCRNSPSPYLKKLTPMKSNTEIQMSQKAAEAIAAFNGGGGLAGAIAHYQAIIARRLAQGKASPSAEAILPELLHLHSMWNCGNLDHDEIMFKARRMCGQA